MPVLRLNEQIIVTLFDDLVGASFSSSIAITEFHGTPSAGALNIWGGRILQSPFISIGNVRNEMPVGR